MDSDNRPNPLERLAEAYSVMLERANEFFEKTEEQARPAFEKAVERAQQTAQDLGELTREEARLVGDYLRRDLQDAGRHLGESGREFREWFRFDVGQVEARLWEAFASAADRTSLELLRLAGMARKHVTYRRGEITGPGTLVCDACGEEVHFDRPSEIPACPRCHADLYHRPD